MRNERFFEDLRQRAHNKFKGLYDERSGPPYSDGFLYGVGNTIAALREMLEEEEEKARQKGPLTLGE